MTRKGWLVALTVILFSFPALAQKITVSGTVTDKDGEPLIGASVVVKGTTAGTMTDIDGVYRLQVEPQGTLSFSYVGYNPQEVAVDNRTHIDVVMTENSVMLNEVVAIGYGVVKKSDATGSIAVIKPDEIEAGIAVSTQDLLVGASPGVVVTTNGGNPTGSGTIRIRGGNSLTASNDPLIVIDGVPMTNQDSFSDSGINALTSVSPQDIESMTVLKDASATAIYGSRASNGVIIITTKKGVSGAPKVTFSANFHLNTARKTLDMMDANELRAVVTDQYGEDAALKFMGPVDGVYYNTDWQKEVLRTSFSHDYALSVAGALGVVPYRVSASYTDSQGILKESGMQRTTVGITVTPKFFDSHLSVIANVNGTYLKNHDADQGAVGGALSYNPSRPVRYAYPTVSNAGLTMFNGYYNNVEESGLLNKNVGANPVELLYGKDNTWESFQSNGNLQLDYAFHFCPDLHANLNLGYQVSKNQKYNYTAANSYMAWSNQTLYNSGAAGAENYNHWYEEQRNTLLEFYLNYRKEVPSIKSNFDVMAGYSWQRFDYHGRSQNYINSYGISTPEGYPSPILTDGVYNVNVDYDSYKHLGMPVANAPMQRWAEMLYLVSFYGRFNYSFDDTYLLTFTIRDDGSSRFSKDNRWGLFPSVALAWKIANMNFFEDIRDTMNDLKLRLGWGITGQQDLRSSYLPYLATYTSSYQNGYLYLSPTGEWINPLYPNASNPDIKWEETTTWNVGLDMAFLNNRINFSADWYLRDTKDLLYKSVIVSQNTSNALNRNIGSLRNTGVELTLTARPVVTRDFTWVTTFNAAYNYNKVTKLTGDSSYEKHGETPDGIGSGLTYYMVGKPADTFRVYEQIYGQDGNPIPGAYVDQNADGVINEDDLIDYHCADPNWTMTWNNTFNYKNWDFGISLRANLNNYVYNNPRFGNTRKFNVLNNGIQINNLMRNEFLFDTTDDHLSLSNYWVENASFLRCDNISVGYTFNNIINNKVKLRLFGVVQNPFVITKYKGIDPEVYGGIDNNVYPRPITVTVGLTANF
ncbi:MAG: TonB-dependent receptor [Muribaculum sp.]|nr:TonB-dependent receptor [Muribaculum sp.]